MGKTFEQEVKIWVDEFEDLKDDPEVTIRVPLMWQDYVRRTFHEEGNEAGFVLDGGCEFDRENHTLQEQIIIERYFDQAEKEAIEEAVKERKENLKL